MKTKEQLISRYTTLYNDMAASKDPSKMMVFGRSEMYVFKELADKHPEMAESWLSHLEEIAVNNYISEHEFMNISKRTINQDGSRGMKWTYGDVQSTVKELGGMFEELPFYNGYALVVTMGMIYSDHAMSIALDMGLKNPKEAPAKEMALSCYRKAVEKLKDLDRPHFVREYFKNQMYDNSPMPK